MPIVNSTIPFINYDGQVYYRDQNVVYEISDYPGIKYHWIEYSIPNNVKQIKNILSDDIIDKIRNEDLYLVLYHSHEASTKIVAEINLLLAQLKIPENKFHLYTESPTVRDLMIDFAKKLGKQPFRCFQTTLFEKFSQDGISQLEYNYTIKPTLEYKTYNKKFLNFNRRWRWHRPILVAHLYLEKLLDQGYVSLADCDDNFDYNKLWNIILELHDKYPDIQHKLIAEKNNILNIPPLILDQSDLKINHANLMSSTFDLYANTYFSVVTETNFYYKQEPALFLTEKIFKPIAHKHPFVVLGRPGTLNFLKKLGYKTFDKLIDESYDMIDDDTLRLIRVVQEIKKLCNLSDDRLREFLNEAQKICDYNYTLLKNKTNFITEI